MTGPNINYLSLLEQKISLTAEVDNCQQATYRLWHQDLFWVVVAASVGNPLPSLFIMGVTLVILGVHDYAVQSQLSNAKAELATVTTALAATPPIVSETWHGLCLVTQVTK